MPPDRRCGDDPSEWMRRARSNLLRAKEDIQFPYIHDLGALLALVEGCGKTIPPQVREAPRLTRFAVETRYPNLDEPVTQEEYEGAVAIADAVVRWAEGEIG